MIARILPRDEWGRLTGSNVPMFGSVRPEDVDIVVVEDGDKIIACLTVLRITHFEGVWIDPESKGLGVTRALLRLAIELARVRGDDWVMGAAENGDERMAKVLDKMGAVRVGLTPYVIALGGESCRLPS